MKKTRQETKKNIDEKMELNVLMLFLSWNKNKEKTKRKK